MTEKEPRPEYVVEKLKMFIRSSAVLAELYLSRDGTAGTIYTFVGEKKEVLLKWGILPKRMAIGLPGESAWNLSSLRNIIDTTKEEFIIIDARDKVVVLSWENGRLTLRHKKDYPS